MAIECTGSNIDTTVCGTEPQTLTFGPQTWLASQSSGNLAVTLDCDIASNSESATCTGSIAAPEAIFTDPAVGLSEISNLLTATTVQLSSTDFSGVISSTDFTYIPVTVTAGQDKLSGSGSGSDSGSSGADSTSGVSSEGSDSGNSAGSLKVSLGLSGLMAGALGLVMAVL
jgi:hypothetical protein